MKKKTNILPPEALKDSETIKNCMFELLYGGLFWHEEIRRLLTTAGFIARRIERMENHPIWRLWLTRTSFDLAADQRTAVKQIHRILVKGGIRVVGDQFDIIDRRGDKLRCYLVLDVGAPGVA